MCNNKNVCFICNKNEVELKEEGLDLELHPIFYYSEKRGKNITDEKPICDWCVDDLHRCNDCNVLIHNDIVEECTNDNDDEIVCEYCYDDSDYISEVRSFYEADMMQSVRSNS